MAGTLYIVATPIGNLEDITLRALRVLKEVDVIAAEDTRVTRKLLSHYDIHTQMVAYHQHSSGRRAEEIVDMIKAGATVALVSDAGTPGISDPGHELIALCIAADLPIQSVPGPAALIPAIVVSGLSTSHFIFDGFPPRKLSERRTYFKSIADETRTIVLYESPLRLSVTLRTIKEVLGDRQVAVIREATKLFEEVFRGDVSEAIERFQGRIRGEIVLVIEGGIPQTNTNPEEVQPLLRRRLAELLASGLSQRDAVRQGTIELKLPRRLVYATMLAMKENGDEIEN